MPNPYFAFKQFVVYHDRCAMKVGTDGVLLGAWADVSTSHHVLDIGTGTGLIALMLAQRSEASIVAIDIDPEAVAQAQDNVGASPWKNRIEVCAQNICCYGPQRLFDTIVSNPPFFVDSLKCPDKQRNAARHSDSLPADVLMGKVSELLLPEGKFSLILPFEQTDNVKRIAEREGLYLTRLTRVVTRPGLAPKRSLMEFGKVRGKCVEKELIIEMTRHVYSEEYIALTKDFYLKM